MWNSERSPNIGNSSAFAKDPFDNSHTRISMRDNATSSSPKLREFSSIEKQSGVNTGYLLSFLLTISIGMF